MSNRWWLVLLLTVGMANLAGAQPAEEQPAPSPTDRLAVQQGALADKYAKLEKLLDEMARIEAVTNPRRASLLLQALKQSKAELTAVKLNSSARLLNQQQLKQALDKQRDAYKDMQALLQLLLSENRSDRLKQEQARIREYIKEVERILRLQKSVQGRTEGGGEPRDLAPDQGKIANRTGQLAQRIRENEEGGGDDGQADGDRPSDEPENAEGDEGQEEKPPGEQEQEGDDSEKDGSEEDGGSGEAKSSKKSSGGEGKKPADAPPSPGENAESSDGQSGDGAKKQAGEGQSGQQGGQQSESGEQGGQQQEQASEDDGNPARKRLQAAEEKMREAQKKLDEAKRNEAVEEQEKAKEELERAKAELEEILRQLREEEIERTLALLEGRFRKMLESQVRIYEDTKSLDESKDELRTQKDSGELAVAERKLVVEADKALNLLLEEGSSIAFPETVLQLREDMQQVADRLDAAKVSKITQAIEEDIIAALEDMIAALQKAQQDMENQQQQQQQQQQGQPGDMPLVDALAELKMVRALQMRVNNRTARYSQLLDDAEDPTGQATDAELREALDKLAERQESIYQITRDLVLGKNK
jgi:hypothetical protein